MFSRSSVRTVVYVSVFFMYLLEEMISTSLNSTVLISALSYYY